MSSFIGFGNDEPRDQPGCPQLSDDMKTQIQGLIDASNTKLKQEIAIKLDEIVKMIPTSISKK